MKGLPHPYDQMPAKFLSELYAYDTENPRRRVYCAGYELGKWRADGFAKHLIKWLPDFALPKERNLEVSHAEWGDRLMEAANRLFIGEAPLDQGEIGELSAHLICRQFFGTIPICRVFYKSSKKERVKWFDNVHIKIYEDKNYEIWLVEAKFYKSLDSAVHAAIRSINDHIESGVLREQKLIVGPQIPDDIPGTEGVKYVFSDEASLDEFIDAMVIPVVILGESETAAKADLQNEEYKKGVKREMESLIPKLKQNSFIKRIKIFFIYMPMADKEHLADRFRERIKGLQ